MCVDTLYKFFVSNKEPPSTFREERGLLIVVKRFLKKPVSKERETERETESEFTRISLTVLCRSNLVNFTMMCVCVCVCVSVLRRPEQFRLRETVEKMKRFSPLKIRT